MTIKPVSSANPKSSSSSDTSDSDAGVSTSALPPYHRSLGQESDARSREPDKSLRQMRRHKKPRQRRCSPPLSHSQAAPAREQKQRGGEVSGYNSSDERDSRANFSSFPKEDEDVFEQLLLKERGFIIKKMKEDGACLFRAVADQVYGDAEFHGMVRANCMDYIAKNRDFFSQYVTEDFTQYVARKRDPHCYGNYVEMQAISEVYNRSIEVYQYKKEPINIFHNVYRSKDAPIRVSYHFDIHYNSLVDPANPSVGVGLGLADFEPGLADRSLLRDAFNRSEKEAIEESMLRSELSRSDWEATANALEEEVLRNSYQEFVNSFKGKEREEASRRKRRRSPRSSAAFGSDDDDDEDDNDGDDTAYASRFSPPKRPSPPSSPSLQALQHMQKHHMALLRVRKENMQQVAAGSTGPRRSMASSASSSSSSSSTTARPGACANSRPSSAHGGRVASTPTGCTPSPPPKTAATSPPSSRSHSPPALHVLRSAAAAALSPPAVAAVAVSISPSSAPPTSMSTSTEASMPSLSSSSSATYSCASASGQTVTVTTSMATSSSSVQATLASLVQTDAMVAAELAAAQILGTRSGVENIDDAQVLASVLAASEQQYFEDLKARHLT